MRVAQLAVLLVVLTVALPAASQHATPGDKMDEPHGGIGLSWYMPKGKIAESHDSGFGISLMFAYPVSNHLDFTGNVAWSKYEINEQPGNALWGSEDITVWEFTAGPRIRVSIAYLGLEGGYYTIFDEWTLVPNAGIRWRILDLGYRIKMGDDTEVHSIRAGVFF